MLVKRGVALDLSCYARPTDGLSARFHEEPRPNGKPSVRKSSLTRRQNVVYGSREIYCHADSAIQLCLFSRRLSGSNPASAISEVWVP
jgi:hypothetical protein